MVASGQKSQRVKAEATLTLTLRPSLQTSQRVAPNTFYESKQVRDQPRFKRQEKRCSHFLMGGAVKLSAKSLKDVRNEML